VFSVAEIVDRTGSDPGWYPGLKRVAIRILPSLGLNLKAEGNFATLVDLLLRANQRPRVLVIGGRTVGDGMQPLLMTPSIELVETDVQFGPRTALICDAHDLPFADESFDGVIIQGVVQVLVDPYRCVAEIHRVLNNHGLVYAEVPFMQQVMGSHDFARFTHLGVLRLFRAFEELRSGVVGGPGMALAWTHHYFLRSFVKTRASSAIVDVLSRLLFFGLRYFDCFLIDKPGALDAASGYYFLGRKADLVLTDRELITRYRGTKM
jgi:SAM-dependent methyltransferase